MGQGLGMDSWLSVDREGSYGSTPAAAEKYARIIRDDIKVGQTPKIRRGMSGAGRRVKFLGRVRAAGPLMFETHFEGIIGELLYSAMGAKGVSGTTEFTHDFDTIQTGALKSFQLEISKGDIPTGKCFVYTGVVVDRLAFIFDDEETVEIEVTLGCSTRTTNVTASGTPTYPTEVPIEFWQLGATGVTVAGTAALIRSGRLEINNNLDLDRYLMTRSMREPKRRQRRQITFTGEIEFEDLALLDKLDAGTEGAFSQIYTSDILIPTSAEYYSLTITGAASFLSDGEPTVSDEGQIVMPVTCDFLEPAGSELNIELINGEATYS